MPASTQNYSEGGNDLMVLENQEINEGMTPTAADRHDKISQKSTAQQWIVLQGEPVWEVCMLESPMWSFY